MSTEDICVVAFDDKLHGAGAIDAVEESWAQENRLVRALALDTRSCREIAAGIVEAASGSETRGASFVAVDSTRRVTGFHLSYLLSPRLPVQDMDFEHAMARRGQSYRAYGIFTRTIDLLCQAQANAARCCLGLPPLIHFTRMIGGVRPGVPKGVFKAMSMNTWNAVFSSVMKGGPAVISYGVATHPATIRYALSSQNNSVVCPALGCARRLNFRVDRGLSANATAAAMAEAAAEEAAVAADGDLDSLSRWKLQVIPTAHGSVYCYILCLRIDVSRTFGALHEGFATWPAASTHPADAPVATVTVICTSPPPPITDVPTFEPLRARL
jgi:hypothetical protein